MSPFPHAFDREALSAYLAAHVAGFARLDAIERFAGGQSNPTYRITSAGRDFVLRARPRGTLLPSAHRVDREFRVMAALADTAVPVPRVLHLSGDDSPLSVRFLVMEAVAGRTFWDPALPGLAPRERGAIYRAMSDTLADLHGVDPAAVGLADFGRPGNYFGRQLARWSQQYRASATDVLPDVERLIGWLEAAMPDDDGQARIVHGDWRLDNLMIAPDRPAVAAVLDWELSTLGHPMADLAYQCMGLRLGEAGPVRGLAGTDRAALGIPTEAAYVAGYCARRGIEPPGDWTFHLAFAHFRFLAIIQGVIARARGGNASNPGDVDAMRATVRDLAAAALAIARDGA